MKSDLASWRQTMPEFLNFLEGKLNHRVRLHFEELGFHVYLVDFSAWKLHFSDHTPVISVTNEDLNSQSAKHLGQSLVELIRIHHFTLQNPILLLHGDGAALREFFSMSLTPVMILNRADLEAIVNSRRPSGELLERLSRDAPLTALAPYETSKPVTGSHFFGRRSDVRRIMTSDANFAVIGIRRIGKTSLLKEVQEQWTTLSQESGGQQSTERIIFMDCSAIHTAEQFMQEVVRRLHPQELNRIGHRHFPMYFPDFLGRMAHRLQGPLVFLLDEFDALLGSQASASELPDTFRAASSMGSSRFIIAGFRRLRREMDRLNSPFYNFARTLRLKEFTREEAAGMIVDPMRNLGIHFERPHEIVDRIFEETAGQPNLVQFYCSILVEQLDRSNSRTLSPENLFAVHEHEDLRSFILNTFMDNTTHLEKAIVFAVLSKYYLQQQKQFDLEMIDNALADHGAHGLLADLEQACRDLELAGVFVKQGQHYHFATPIFPTILRESYNVDYLFRKVIDEGVW